MSRTLKSLLALSTLTLAAQASAQITFYEGEGFRGRAFTTDRAVDNFANRGFNDRASSVTVDRGRWEVCENARYDGRCVFLRKGSYDSLRALGMENRISSARTYNGRGRGNRASEAPEPLPAADYEYRRRPNERVYEVPVTSVRAVVGPPNERCWVERQQVSDQGRGPANVGGAIVGAILGGVLGHQVGGGHGKDLATAGGAVAGAAVGANVGRSGGPQERDVRRCETTASEAPAYWDVVYQFRGTDHRIQMSAPPGRTISVNSNGEPRQ